MFRLEIQKNQKFDRFFVNFCFFDSDCLDSNNLSTLRRFNDFFCSKCVECLWLRNHRWRRTLLSVCVWVSWLMRRAVIRRWWEWLFDDFVLSFASSLFVNSNVLRESWDAAQKRLRRRQQWKSRREQRRKQQRKSTELILMMLILTLILMMLIRETKFCFENRSETRKVLLFLHCWMRDKFREMTNKAWQR
jgi:predicted nucleic acid-binding Zn ribbon protein